MKASILLALFIVGSVQALPTLREIYTSAKNAIGIKNTDAEIPITTETNVESAQIPEPEVVTSRFRAAVDRAKSYIPSASSLVPRFSYKDGTISYSWAMFHMSGGIHRRTTTPTPNTIVKNRIAEENLQRDDYEDITEHGTGEIISGKTHRSTTFSKPNTIVRIGTEEESVQGDDYGEEISATTDENEDRTSEIRPDARSDYDRDFPPLPAVDEDRSSADSADARSQMDEPIQKKEGFLNGIVHNKHVKTEDVNFWKAEEYLGKKFGRPLFTYLMDNDLL